MATASCDRCGACCNGTLIVEAENLDALREPRLLDADVSDRRLGLSVLDDAHVVLLACGRDHPCRFLGADNVCGIYPTRPNACVAFEAGSEQCREARAAVGLPPL
jgi:Fe-S-cluster containining protein